jgi:hypothetical protein
MTAVLRSLDVTPLPGPRLDAAWSGDSEVVEMPLLMPRWQAEELENIANERGMTTGQMIRRILADILRR